MTEDSENLAILLCEHYQEEQRDFLKRAVEACVKGGVYGAEGILRRLEIVCICRTAQEGP